MLLSTILLFSSLLLSFLVINKLACSIFRNQGLNFKRKRYQNSQISLLASRQCEQKDNCFYCNPFLNKLKPVFIWISESYIWILFSERLRYLKLRIIISHYKYVFIFFMCYSLLNDSPVDSPINTICLYGLTLTYNKGWLYY